MPRLPSGRLAALVLAAAAIGSVLALGVWVRAIDPLSSPVMVAEDPYTHMSLVREHVRDGVLQPQNPTGSLYPPGLHGFLAAFWSYSGVDLYELVRFGPVLFGAVGIVGIALLVGRWEGLLAAFGAALAMASMPETIARTTMMSPTAVDLALLPFLMAAVLEVLRGRLAWLVAAGPIAVFLALAHPWVLALAVIAGFLFVLLYVAFPWRAERGPPLTRHGVAASVALLGGVFGAALMSRWQASGTGFSELTLPMTDSNAGVLGLVAVVVALVVAGVLALLPRMTRRRLPALNRRQNPTIVQAAGCVGLVALLILLTLPAMAQGMPDFVDLPRMLGWPVLALAALALVVVPLAGSPAAHTGAAWFLATFPFCIYNPLNSPYWPHRTVVFLGFGAAILVGIAVRRIADTMTPAVRTPAGKRLRSLSATRRATFAAAAPALLVGVSLSGVVLAGTPEPYEGGWYRLFNTCEFDALRGVAQRANEDPDALVVTGSWESQLVIAAFTEKASRVWFKADLFQPAHDRTTFERARLTAGGPTYVVVDRWLPAEVRGADWSFLDHGPYVKLQQACEGSGEMRHKFTLYALLPGA